MTFIAEIRRLTGGVTAMRYVLEERRRRMTPALRGVPAALDKLRHKLDAEAEKLANRIEGANVRSDNAFAKSHKILDSADEGLKEIEQYVTDLERSNSGELPRSSTVAELQK